MRTDCTPECPRCGAGEFKLFLFFFILFILFLLLVDSMLAHTTRNHLFKLISVYLQ